PCTPMVHSASRSYNQAFPGVGLENQPQRVSKAAVVPGCLGCAPPATATIKSRQERVRISVIQSQCLNVNVALRIKARSGTTGYVRTAFRFRTAVDLIAVSTRSLPLRF